jgi:hypothetical protein
LVPAWQTFSTWVAGPLKMRLMDWRPSLGVWRQRHATGLPGSKHPVGQMDGGPALAGELLERRFRVGGWRLGALGTASMEAGSADQGTGGEAEPIRLHDSSSFTRHRLGGAVTRRNEALERCNHLHLSAPLLESTAMGDRTSADGTNRTNEEFERASHGERRPHSQPGLSARVFAQRLLGSNSQSCNHLKRVSPGVSAPDDRFPRLVIGDLVRPPGGVVGSIQPPTGYGVFAKIGGAQASCVSNSRKRRPLTVPPSSTRVRRRYSP